MPGAARKGDRLFGGSFKQAHGAQGAIPRSLHPQGQPLRPPPASLGSPSQEGRDALSKRAGGTFVAKAGSKLCLRPGQGCRKATERGLHAFPWRGRCPSAHTGADEVGTSPLLTKFVQRARVTPHPSRPSREIGTNRRDQGSRLSLRSKRAGWCGNPHLPAAAFATHMVQIQSGPGEKRIATSAAPPRNDRLLAWLRHIFRFSSPDCAAGRRGVGPYRPGENGMLRVSSPRPPLSQSKAQRSGLGLERKTEGRQPCRCASSSHQSRCFDGNPGLDHIYPLCSSESALS